MITTIEIGRKYPEITGALSDEFTGELNALCDDSNLTELILDFEGTRIINSMAMSALFSTYTKLKAQGKTLHIVRASEKVTHLLRMVNMADLLR